MQIGHQMLNLFITIKGASMIFGIAAFSLFLGDTVSEITGETHVTLGSLVAVCSVVGGGALFVGKWMQKVETSIKELKARIENLPCHDNPEICPKKKP